MRLKVIPKIQSRVYAGELLKAAFGSLRPGTIGRFEKEFSELIGMKHSIAAFSGRSALLATLSALNFAKGDEIIMPGYTFQGIPQMIIASGLKPVFADVDDRTLNINPNKIDKLISGKTRAILIVHNLGNPCEMDAILKICKKHKLKLIEDCAHSLGSEYKGRRIGTFGDVSIFSFHYSKVINTYWGGMACTNDSGLAGKIRENIKSYRKQSVLQVVSRLAVSVAQSIATSQYIYSFIFYPLNRKMAKSTGKDIIEHLYQLKPQDPDAHRFRFTGFQAHIGLSQLKKLKEFNRMRKHNSDIFRVELDKKIPIQETGSGNVFIPLQLVCFVKEKKKMLAMLENRRIEARDFYIPALAELPEFKGCRNNCTISRRINKEIIFFATFQYLSDDEIKYLARSLNHIYNTA